MEAFFSKESAQEVANVVQSFLNGNHGENYFKLMYNDRTEKVKGELMVRPHPSKSVFTKENNEQIVFCEVEDSARTVILLVPVMDRQYVPATVVIV